MTDSPSPRKRSRSKLPKYRGETLGVKFSADVTVPKADVTALAAKLSSVVRGKALPGYVTLTFPPGPGTEQRIATALKALYPDQFDDAA